MEVYGEADLQVKGDNQYAGKMIKRHYRLAYGKEFYKMHAKRERVTTTMAKIGKSMVLNYNKISQSSRAIQWMLDVYGPSGMPTDDAHEYDWKEVFPVLKTRSRFLIDKTSKEPKTLPPHMSPRRTVSIKLPELTIETK